VHERFRGKPQSTVAGKLHVRVEQGFALSFSDPIICGNLQACLGLFLT
jgi:hypothetical protein